VFGHGTGLADEEIRVPLVLCGPHRPSSRYEYSSHADIMPTWLDMMGVSGSPGPFMSGRSLLTYRPETDIAVTGLGVTGTSIHRRYVAAGRGIKVTFNNLPELPIESVTDADDHPLGAIPDLAYTVLAEAVGTKTLRSPSGE
jgi:hypothetical protein